MPQVVPNFQTVSFDQFFDREGVISRVEKKEAKVLSGTGAYGRGAVRRSIRPAGKKGKISSPNSPPRFHTRGRVSLKDRIFFGLDRVSADVVIGPEKFNAKGTGLGGSTVYRLTGGAKTVPELLEKGGARVVLGRGRRGKRLVKPIQQTYKPRPFVGSRTKAFQNTAAKMRDLMEKTEL